MIIIDIDKQGQNGTMIFNILDNTTELWMTKYIIDEIFSSGGATLYKKPSDQTVSSFFHFRFTYLGTISHYKLLGTYAIYYSLNFLMHKYLMQNIVFVTLHGQIFCFSFVILIILINSWYVILDN